MRLAHTRGIPVGQSLGLQVTLNMLLQPFLSTLGLCVMSVPVDVPHTSSQARSFARERRGRARLLSKPSVCEGAASQNEAVLEQRAAEDELRGCTENIMRR